MEIKTGVDIVYIPRVGKLMENEGFIKKAFHASECRNYSAEHIAGVFAAKEAFFKAIGKKPDWLKVEVKNQKTGRPRIIMSDELKEKHKIEDIDVSISHDKDYAIAAISILIKNV
ncbi:MAG: holo-ACP synthase [Nanoarchaeota archaeon]|nr:holo-ACP synthase [Nanoarchaeota archaeon]